MELVTDPRSDSAEARRENNELCVELIDGIFAERPLDEWSKMLEQAELPLRGLWAQGSASRSAGTGQRLSRICNSRLG
jgi:crotonobetainyl-CoA:carnitine CoA-transferase CaiB-like acyl-CoA transferase